MIWLTLVSSIAGGVALGWYAHLWWCKRSLLGCPIWQQESKLIWKAKWRKRYPNGSRERHPTPAPVDSHGGSGVPCVRRDTPSAETDLTNSKRRTP